MKVLLRRVLKVETESSFLKMETSSKDYTIKVNFMAEDATIGETDQRIRVSLKEV